MNIRLLQPEDWGLWREFRLAGLLEEPKAFGSSFEEESAWSDEKLKDVLTKNDIFGAFVDGQLVGSLALSIFDRLKMRHRGMLWGMYVRPQNRVCGVASELIKHVIADARAKVVQLHLTVVTDNPIAIQFYEKNGFRIYGTEPRSLKIGDRFYDEHLMVLKLD